MRVLLVDDDKTIVDTLGEALQAEGIAVDGTCDSSEGSYMAREGDYDVIILDLQMPGVNGNQICKLLRAANVWSPILILTAHSAEKDETQALNTGADDFLSKPFSFQVLIARLHALARRGYRPRPRVMQIADLKLDPLQRTCIRSGNSLTLTMREFALLEYMMRRSGEVLSKHQILDHVWGFDCEGDYNLVEVYISYLRRKVDDPFDIPLIQTVRGAGYRLCQPH